jgi:hypothetical protein
MKGVRIVRHLETNKSYMVVRRMTMEPGGDGRVWYQLRGWKGEDLVMPMAVTEDLGWYVSETELCAESATS